MACGNLAQKKNKTFSMKDELKKQNQNKIHYTIMRKSDQTEEANYCNLESQMQHQKLWTRMQS